MKSLPASGKLTVGHRYTRPEINSFFGGGDLTSYLPHADNKVLCGCFDPTINSHAPNEIDVGEGPDVVKYAKILAHSKATIPVFIKRETSEWEYVGDYRARAFSDDPKDLRMPGRRPDTVGVLFLEKAESVKRNPNWTRDELILALDLYFKLDFAHTSGQITESQTDIVLLSSTLNSLPIHSNRPDESRFRNPNGVYMKLCNFLRLDPEYQGKGLDAGSKLDEIVWEEFAGDRNQLTDLASAIAASPKILETNKTDTLIEEEFPEGQVLTRVHKSRERNSKLVERAKMHSLERHGKLICEACGFDFEKVYGELGHNFIEAHHTLPLSTRNAGKTKIQDLAMVCSNCHRMIHKKRPWLSMDGIVALLKRN